MKSSKSKLVDDKRLFSKNERLIGEMAKFLASIEHSPGANSVETAKADNCSHSSADLSASSENLPAPPFNDSEDDDQEGIDCREAKKEVGNRSAQGDGGPVRAAKEKESTARRKPTGRSLVPIDENGGGTTAGAEYEYFNDFSSDNADDNDDDSLVAMAKRMDAASIVSDPSLICGPSEKFNLYKPKNLAAGVKKLGQKMTGGGQHKPEAPPPYPRGKPPPAPPPRKSPVQRHRSMSPQSSGLPPHQQHYQPIHTDNSPVPPELKGLLRIPQRKSDHSPSTAGSPSSSSGDLTLDTYDQNKRQLSSSLNSALVDNSMSQKVSQGMGAASEPNLTGRRHSHSPKATRNESQTGRRGSGRKSSRSRTPSRDAQNANNVDGAAGEAVAARNRSLSRSRRRKSKHKKKKKHKKKQKDRMSESEESMRGLGFNTRINPKVKRDGQPELEQTLEQDEDSMHGMGSNTRIHNNPNVGTIPESDRMPERTERRSQNIEEGADDQSNDSERTEIFYESVTDSDASYSSEYEADSVYDSDNQTQIFYESTDDEYDSEEERAAVGRSVADAVEDLNKKRAITKVKKLLPFGRR